jgi:hypothetical protein
MSHSYNGIEYSNIHVGDSLELTYKGWLITSKKVTYKKDGKDDFKINCHIQKDGLYLNISETVEGERLHSVNHGMNQARQHIDIYNKLNGIQ